MEKIKKIELIFGKPENGWLPTIFRHVDFELSFDASDVPKNPTDLLCESLISTLKGINSEMYWFLEPEYYLFEIIPIENKFDLLISRSNIANEKLKQIYKISGGFDTIILPLYRSLKKFSSLEFGCQDWKKIDETELNKLTELITERKNSLQHSV
ncbi:hypothetical protein [Mangrovimonas sp. YM274]|uniref:hypothetical protein n=1 Tax=Mangrovimonas sp. YM274 TaxID=3070660 RepID=UPI0027DAB839|nr:hypothetical protein [Mangrovimonas sp. YM274]WMI68249.1 hypothetical protein RBH95_14000 [Mangrovimonas sp. YM274]